MKRKVIILLILTVISLTTVYVFFGYPLVLKTGLKEVLSIKDTTQINFNPLENINFSTGDNIAYLLLSRADINELPAGMRKSKVFECKSNQILQSLKDNFLFNKTNGDMATCESELYIYKGNKLVFHSSIVLTDNTIGIQSKLFGWADVIYKEKIKNIFLQFKPVKEPIIKF